LTLDEAKDFTLETCKTPMQMDIAEMTRGLEKWGFKITDFERLSDMAQTDVLQEYMVWLECNYGAELMKQNVINWLEGLPDWPWLGHWCFVVKFHISNQPRAEWTFEIVRWSQGGWSTRKTDAVPKWPDQFTRRKKI
jgi:hypothetical protein